MANFEVKAGYGSLGKRNNGTEVRLTKTSWYGKAPQWDIRNWDGEYARQGITLSDDMMRELKDLLNSIDL